jgi:hypothetical protein
VSLQIKQLGQLAELVGNNLHHEVDAALKQLDVADQVLQKNPNILDSKFKENELCDTLSKHPLMKMHNVLYPFFSHIVWADGMGNQMIRWTTDEYCAHENKYRRSSLFYQRKKDRLWVRDGREYYLETSIHGCAAKRSLSFRGDRMLRFIVEE